MKTIFHSNYLSQEKEIYKLINNFFLNKNSVANGNRNTIKYDYLENEKITIKFFQKPGFLKSIIYTFFRSSKAKRSFEYANYLINNDILTPFPIAYIEEKNKLGLLSNSFYICKHIEYDFTIRELIHNPLFKDRELILQQFTNFTFKMHEAKINFLDHSPGNTLILKNKIGIYNFFLIDLNRMKFQNLSVEKRMDNFKKMWLSKTMVYIIAKKYASLINCPQEELTLLLLKKTREFKLKTARKKYLKLKLKHIF